MENLKSNAVHAHARIYSIDIVRGLAIIFMVLDHARDFFSSSLYDPTNLAVTYPAMFLSRWITHFCAAAFVLLAGTSAFLFGARGRTKADLAFFLLTRGAWLITLEFTLVQWGWAFNFDYHHCVCQVMWAIGWSMISLSVLIFLPAWLILLISLTLIAGHNLLDGINVYSWGRFSWLFKVLHVPGTIILPSGIHVEILYPLIPWIGVMALGYIVGPMFFQEPHKRRINFFKLGLSLILAFIIIRTLNVYGDPYAWSVQKIFIYTFLSFINITKYPPSLIYLLITLGITFILLGFFTAKEPGPISRFLLIFGRVPMFFYLLHVPLIHLIAVIFAYIKYGNAAFLFQYSIAYLDVAISPDAPVGYGYGLAVSYFVWILAIAILYPLCRWYGGFKKNHSQYRLLSYF